MCLDLVKYGKPVEQMGKSRGKRSKKRASATEAIFDATFRAAYRIGDANADGSLDAEELNRAVRDFRRAKWARRMVAVAKQAKYAISPIEKVEPVEPVERFSQPALAEEISTVAEALAGAPKHATETVLKILSDLLYSCRKGFPLEISWTWIRIWMELSSGSFH